MRVGQPFGAAFVSEALLAALEVSNLHNRQAYAAGLRVSGHLSGGLTESTVNTLGQWLRVP